jgi:hypothetical protein
MRSKQQTTRAKLARERLVQERRALKQEKKRAAREAAAELVDELAVHRVDGDAPHDRAEGEQRTDSS